MNDTTQVDKKKFKLRNVRLVTYGNSLFVANAYEPGQKAKFKADFLIEKTDKAQIKVVEAAIKAAAEEKWGEKASKIIDVLRPDKMKFCFRDGDTKEFHAYEDMMFVSANNTSRVDVRDRDRSILAEADGRPYSGCYVNAILSIWAQDNPKTKTKGIRCNLLGVQFVKDGESFGGGTKITEDEYEDLGNTDDDLDI